MKQRTILVVDDNRNILATVRMLLEKVFARVVTIASPGSIPARLREDKPDVVLLDMNFQSGINTGNEGIFWLHEIKRMRPETQVVLFTAYADIELAVKGMREGAADFIVKPFDNKKLVETLKNLPSAPANNLQQEEGKAKSAAKGPLSTLKGSQSDGYRDNADDSGAIPFRGNSPAMQDLRLMVEKVAPTDANILITGENGTGKEVLARQIHALSRRAGGPLLIVDMGAVSETLFESELFGHVKGAFTDAKADKPGKFELANGGTIVLDEIGNLSYALQAKLLTALQRRSIVRVGGSKEIPVDVRLICATNKDLWQMVAKGEFREDLLYRINTIHLNLPPLRERKGDIADLARLFLDRYAKKYGRQGMSLSDSAAAQAERMPWHGNIRELQHAVEKAVILTDGDIIKSLSADSPTSGTPDRGRNGGDSGDKEPQTLDEMEKQAIVKAINDNGGNLSLVAKQLAISRQTLYNKIKKYGI